jgi:DNA-binding GntR family transcriptional regulator
MNFNDNIDNSDVSELRRYMSKPSLEKSRKRVRKNATAAPALRAAKTKVATTSDKGATPGVDDVVRQLEEDIIFGRLKPRERLVEDALMQRLGAKRHVVRHSLTELERLGIVVRQHNKGSAVRDFEPSEVEAIYDVRAILQRHAAKRVPLPAPKPLIDKLKAIHKRHAKAVDKGDLPTVYRLNNDFHDTIFSACGNPYLVETISEYAWLVHAIRSYRIADPKLLRQARDEHAMMIEALEAGDRKTLVTLCVNHIRPSKQAYLAQQHFAKK